MDRYLSRAKLRNRSQLQLVGATSLFIVAKALNVDNTYISIDHIAVILAGIFDLNSIKVCRSWDWFLFLEFELVWLIADARARLVDDVAVESHHKCSSSISGPFYCEPGATDDCGQSYSTSSSRRHLSRHVLSGFVDLSANLLLLLFIILPFLYHIYLHRSNILDSFFTDFLFPTR